VEGEWSTDQNPAVAKDKATQSNDLQFRTEAHLTTLPSLLPEMPQTQRTDEKNHSYMQQ